MNHIHIIKALLLGRYFKDRDGDNVYSRKKNESSSQNNFDGRSFGMLNLQAGADLGFYLENTYK